MPDSLLSPFWGSPPFDERDLDALLAGNGAHTPLPLRPVADALTALQGVPSPAELRGEAAAMAEFRAQAGSGTAGAAETAPAAGLVTAGGTAPTVVLPAGAGSARPRNRRRRPLRPRGARSRARRGRTGLLAAVAALVAVAATVAYSGDLPAPAQRLAHNTFAAPSPKQAGGTPSSSGVDAKSASAVPAPGNQTSAAAPSAGGNPRPPTSGPSGRPGKANLCDTFLRAVGHPARGSQPWWKSAVYAELSAAAGSPQRIPAYCAPVWAKIPHHGVPLPPDLPGKWPTVPQPGTTGAGQDGNATAAGGAGAHGAGKASGAKTGNGPAANSDNGPSGATSDAPAGQTGAQLSGPLGAAAQDSGALGAAAQDSGALGAAARDAAALGASGQSATSPTATSPTATSPTAGSQGTGSTDQARATSHGQGDGSNAGTGPGGVKKVVSRTLSR